MSRSTLSPQVRRALFRVACASLLSLPTLALAGAALAFDSDADTVSDAADAFPCNAQSASVVFAPAQGSHGMVLFEDQWPEQSDLDFNDAAISYNYIFELDAAGAVRSIRANFNVLAVGGVFNNGFALQLPVPASSVASIRETIGTGAASSLSAQGADSQLTVRVLSNLRSVFGDKAGPINSNPALGIDTAAPIELEIRFSTPQVIDLSQAPFDLFLFRTQAPTHEIHRPQYPGTAIMNQGLFHTGLDGSSSLRHFVDTQGLPFALTLPSLRPWPQEGISIDRLYPNITQFAASGGTQAQDFYQSAVDLNSAFGWTAPDLSGLSPEEHGGGTGVGSVPEWTSPVAARFVGPDSIPADTGCVNAWGLSVGFGTARDTYGYDSVMDSAGNIFVTGYTTRSFANYTNQGAEDIFLAKYNRQTGALIWSVELGGTSSDIARSVAVDSAGNIYLAGETRSALNGQTSAGQVDAFVMKFDSTGNRLWTRLLGGTGYDYGTSVGVDSSGAIFLAGGSTSTNLAGATYPGNGPYSFLAKFDAAGNRLWTQAMRTDGANGSNYNYTADLGVDASGNVIVVGSERRYNQSPDASENQFVAKCSGSNGSVIWVRHIGDHGVYQSTTNYQYAHAQSVAIDSTGSAYVVGNWEAGALVSGWDSWSRTAGDSSSDATLVKVDANGNVLWSRSIASTNGKDDAALTAVADSSGVVLTGYTAGNLAGQSSRGAFDYFVSRYDASGTPLWTIEQGSTSNDGGFGVGVDSAQGVVYVVGNTGDLSGVPTAFRDTYYGFIATHNLSSGAQTSFIPTVDTRIITDSCRTRMAAGAPSGVYTVDPDDAGPISPFDVYCDMTTAGGGWTLVFSAASRPSNWNSLDLINADWNPTAPSTSGNYSILNKLSGLNYPTTDVMLTGYSGSNYHVELGCRDLVKQWMGLAKTMTYPAAASGWTYYGLSLGTALECNNRLMVSYPGSLMFSTKTAAFPSERPYGYSSPDYTWTMADGFGLVDVSLREGYTGRIRLNVGALVGTGSRVMPGQHWYGATYGGSPDSTYYDSADWEGGVTSASARIWVR